MKNNLFYLFIILVLTACTFGKKNKLQNSAFIYSENISKAQPFFKIYHNSNTESTLFCKLKSKELLSVFSASEKQNKINYSISGKLFLADNKSIVIDSFTLQKSIVDTAKWIKETFTFSSNLNEHYMLKINFTDENKLVKAEKIIYFEKEKDAKENFQIFKEQKIQFATTFNLNDTLIIQNNTEQEKLSVRYFNENFPLAKAPFVLGAIKSKEIIADKFFSITSDTTFFILPINRQGIYQILENETFKNGMSILAFENDFPKITSAKNMIAPLQYICSNEEFLQLKEINNKKIAIDEFWLSRAKGDKSQAKKLIQTFYKRVENANSFFTSYKAGWKTDRGMIMIIFGAPNIIYQSKEGESWIYGEKNNMYALNFTFTKIKNKFSDKDFELNRSAYFKNIWSTAQRSWREGHAYSDMDIKEKIYEQERRQRQSQLYFWY